MAIGVRLMGGLGNQMFQYAAARSLAARHRTDVVIDLGWFVDQPVGGDTRRVYGLDVFSGPAASPKADLPSAMRFHERGFGFDPLLEDLPDQSSLTGYFQSERYFGEHAAVIREAFSFREAPDGPNRTVLEMACTCDSVAVHVRRGDYATNEATNAHHGLLPVDYYRRAADEVALRVPDPLFFVFSDDPEWCRTGLSFLPRGVVVDHNPADGGVEDLRLMASCRHHILANSTFSWWGAWLARHPDQVVIAPRRWFAGEDFDTADLCPSQWLLR